MEYLRCVIRETNDMLWGELGGEVVGELHEEEQEETLTL